MSKLKWDRHDIQHAVAILQRIAEVRETGEDRPFTDEELKRIGALGRRLHHWSTRMLKKD